MPVEVTTQPAPGQQKSKPILTLSDGRKLRLCEPHVLASLDLVAALGSLAENRVYTAMVFPLIYLDAIDDDAELFVTSIIGVRGLVQRLGTEGMRVLREGVATHFGTKDEDEEKNAIKK